MSSTGILNPVDLPPAFARRVPRPSRGDGWNILADVEVFVFAVEAELEAMDRERVGVHRRGRKPDLSLRRRLIELILTFGGMQWRIAGWLSGIPFTTLHSTFARWSRLGLWRRLGQRLTLDWRLARDDEVLPSAVVADSRSLRSAPSAGHRWRQAGQGHQTLRHLRQAWIPARSRAAPRQHGRPRGHPADAAETGRARLPGRPSRRQRLQGRTLRRGGARARHPRLGLARCTRDGRLLPSGIRWVVERLFAWLSRYRRLNIVYDRAPDLFAAHVWIAMVSIISRRLVAQTQTQNGI
ncbi:transposase [Belnapia rosea]|nr:transposase [Belnapia rosea]